MAYSLFKEEGLRAKEHPKVIALSDALRQLAANRGTSIGPTFRNPAGCAMKLAQLQFVDTDGQHGLSSASEMDREVVGRYKNDTVSLQLDADIARSGSDIANERLPEQLPAEYCVGQLSTVPDDLLHQAKTPSIGGPAIVQPALKPLGELLKNDGPYSIPRYQRAYSWDEEQVVDLARDVRQLATSLAAGAVPTQHFFGGIVVVHDAGASSWSVIDGQQRLTTFVIIAALLGQAYDRLENRAAVSGDDATAYAAAGNAKDLRESFVWIRQSDPLTGIAADKPRLMPTPADRAAYSAVLRGESFAATRDSQELLLNARSNLWRELFAPIFVSQGSEAERLRALLALQYALFNCCILIKLSANDMSAAYKLFMVLNDRGMQLSEGDLLRAATLEYLERFKVQQEEAALAWDGILSERAGVVQDFLRAYFPSVTGKRADVWELVEDYRRHVFSIEGESTTDQARAKRLVDTLQCMHSEIALFGQLQRAEWPYANSRQPIAYTIRVRRLIKTLRHELAHPLLLAGAAILEESDFLRLVVAVERFAVRYKNIGGGHPDRAAKVYYDHAVCVRESGKLQADDLVAKLCELAEEVLPDDEIVDRLKDRLRYDKNGQRGNIRWVLAALEDFHGWLASDPQKRSPIPAPDQAVVLDADLAHIDHIYPQTARVADRDDELELVKHHLGNLTLLEARDNRLKSNTPFVDKRDVYRASSVRHTKALARKRLWSVSRVSKREDDLFETVQALLKF
ncbi:DUF262 domain-containing protein [Blastococcus sp. SYSU D01042]